MRNFSIMPLEERIVLDASLISSADFITQTVNLREVIDLSGPGRPSLGETDGWAIRYSNVGPLTATEQSGTMIITNEVGTGLYGINQSSIARKDGTLAILNFSPVTQTWFFTAPGVYHVYIDFNLAGLSNLEVATITVLPPPDNEAPAIVQTFDRSGQEGTTSRQLLAKVTDLNTVSVVSGSSDNANITISNLTSEADSLVSGQYNIYGDIGFVDVASGNLSITLRDPNNNNSTFSVAVNATDAPLHEIDVGPLSLQEGPALISFDIAKFVDENPNSVASDFAVSLASSSPSTVGLNLVSLLKQNDGTYVVAATPVAFDYNPAVVFTITVTDAHDGSRLVMTTDFVSTDAPLTVRSNDPISGVEGAKVTDQLIATFTDGNRSTLPTAFSAVLSNPNVDATNVRVTKTSPRFGTPWFEVRADLTFKDVIAPGSKLNVQVFDADGGPNSPLTFAVDISAVDAPLSLVSSNHITAVEGAGNSSMQQLAVFHDGNGLSQASDFQASLNGLINGDFISSWSITKDGNGDYVVSAVIPLSPDNDAGSYPLSLTIQDIDGQNLIVPLNYDITNAPWSLGGALSVDALAGAPFVGKIGSFVDSNPNENVANYQVIVDSDLNAAGNQGSGYLVQTGLGAYDVYGQLTYNASGSQAGTFTIMDMSNFGAPNPSETLVGGFTANVRPNQLLWGVDQSNGQLFSVGDYSLPGAESRVNLYGQLHTAAGVIIGNDIQAFTIDGADANGRNAAFVAISKSVGGINTFSIGVIADINDPAHRTEVTLYKISGMNFNLLKDNITGLAIDPNSGNILGVVVRDNAPATLFVIDKNTLSSADHIAKAYTLGKIIGTDDLGGQKVTNARDLAFDSSGNLFVTDGAKDKLYQISAANGEILAVSNMNEDNGLGEANIEALAWDPVLGKLIGANSILNAGLPANDLVGLSTANGPNTIDVNLLQSLKDVEGMAFMPKFGLRSGDNLGVLIDTGRTEVDYRAGQGPVLLLRDVELISFGEDTYDNGSLTVDVSGVDIGEFFAIKAGDGIAIDAAGNIRYKGLFFGTIDALENGKNGKALTIHFNANASEKAVEHLMERITYLNTDSALILVDKVIAFTIKDSLGAVIGYTTINLDIESRTSSHC